MGRHGAALGPAASIRSDVGSSRPVHVDARTLGAGVDIVTSPRSLTPAFSPTIGDVRCAVGTNAVTLDVTYENGTVDSRARHEVGDPTLQRRLGDGRARAPFAAEWRLSLVHISNRRRRRPHGARRVQRRRARRQLHDRGRRQRRVGARHRPAGGLSYRAVKVSLSQLDINVAIDAPLSAVLLAKRYIFEPDALRPKPVRR